MGGDISLFGGRTGGGKAAKVKGRGGWRRAGSAGRQPAARGEKRVRGCEEAAPNGKGFPRGSRPLQEGGDGESCSGWEAGPTPKTGLCHQLQTHPSLLYEQVPTQAAQTPERSRRDRPAASCRHLVCRGTAGIQKPLTSFPASLSVSLLPRPEPRPTHPSDHPKDRAAVRQGRPQAGWALHGGGREASHRLRQRGHR